MRTSRTIVIRGMSVSRRSSRFGGHPDAATGCRFTGKRCLQSSSEDVEPLTFLSPARIIHAMNFHSCNESSFGPRLLRSLFREIERLPQSETPSLDKNAGSIARPTPSCDPATLPPRPANSRRFAHARLAFARPRRRIISCARPPFTRRGHRPFDTRLRVIDIRGASLSQALLTDFCNS